MKRFLVCMLSLTMVLGLFSGCSSNDNAETPASLEEAGTVTSAPAKEEEELALEKTLWQVKDTQTYLLFHDGKQVSEYDLTLIGEKNSEVEKCLSYAIEEDKKTGRSVYFPYLLGEYDVYLKYQPDDSSFTVQEKSFSLQPASMKEFVEAFMDGIDTAFANKEWESQAEMNDAVGIRCNDWDTLYTAVDRFLKVTLLSKEYDVFVQETDAFETARTKAMEEAGNNEQEGSLYPVVTGDAYCNQTKQQIQSIIEKYFS